jgi:hypothetical protein
MRCYIATSFSHWPVAKRVAQLLADVGVQCSSSWITVAEARCGRDAADTGAPRDISFARECHRQNYADLDESDALLVLRVDKMGEGFFEAYYAMNVINIPVVWVGAPILSVTVSSDVSQQPSAEFAVKHIAWMSKHHPFRKSRP